DPIYGVRAFVGTIWKNGGVQELPTFGGPLAWPGFLPFNDGGQAVGAATNTSPDPDGFARALIFAPDLILPGVHWHAALWQDGTIQDLGTLGDGLDSYAIFVNERGQAAGVSYTNTIPNPEFGIPTLHPFLWENGRRIELGTVGRTYVTLGEDGGLNDRGQVVGQSDVTSDGSIAHAFLWDRGSLHDLGTLGGDFSVANRIDDSGQAIGYATTPGNSTVRATRWK